MQLLKQNAAVVHLLHDLEAVCDNLVPLAVSVQALHGGGHFVLQAADAGQSLEVVDHIQNQRYGAVPCCQSATNLLLIDDGRNRRAEQNHTRNARNVYALVEHINAEQQLEVVAAVRLKVSKGFVGEWILGQSPINRRRGVNGGKPLRHMGNHLVHVFLAGAEHDVLAAFVGDVAGKDFVQSVRLLQGTL